jgi:hypothetical protein
MLSVTGLCFPDLLDLRWNCYICERMGQTYPWSTLSLFQMTWVWLMREFETSKFEEDLLMVVEMFVKKEEKCDQSVQAGVVPICKFKWGKGRGQGLGGHVQGEESMPGGRGTYNYSK